MMHHDVNKIPITELTDKDEIETRFEQMLNDARDAASSRIQCAKRYRKFFMGEQYDGGAPGFGWMGALRMAKNQHIPLMSGEETFESVLDLLPILLKSKPGITIEAEGEMVGENAYIAEIMTDIYENLYRLRSQHVFDSNVVLESLISGVAFTTFSKTFDHRGVTIHPKLLMPEQFLGDPDGANTHDFSDYEYIILEAYRTPYEIEQDYGVKEDDYGAGSRVANDNRWNVFGTMFTAKDKKRRSSVEGMYPVQTLFVRAYTANLDASLDLNEQPPIQKMVFLNDSYYVNDSRMDNPYWHQDFPVTAFKSLPQPYMEMGQSDVATYIATQVAINIARDSSIAVSLFNASPGYEIEDGAIGKNKVDSSPGSINEWNTGSLARGAVAQKDMRDSASSMNLLQLMKQQMQDRKGDTGSLLRGGQPGNIRSAKHFNAAMNSVLTRNGYRVRMLDTAWQRFASQDVSLFQQFVSFSRSWLSKGFEIADELQFMQDTELAEMIRTFGYDINIDSKSDMPATIEEKINLFLTLYDRGLVSPEEFYKQTNIKLSPDALEAIDLSTSSWFPGVPFMESAALGLQASQQADMLASGLEEGT